MKTIVIRNMAALSVAVALGLGNRVYADVSANSVNAPKAKTLIGMASTVDLPSKMVYVHHFWGTKRFNIADGCKVSLQDKPDASLADLRPGQKLEVSYEKSQGVLIAHRIQQQDLHFTGHVMAIDPVHHVLTLRRHALDRTFQIAAECKIHLRGDKDGTLTDVQPGHRVTVTFEVPGGKPTARQIAQTSETFVGVLTAVDLDNRTVKAKSLLAEKTFNLAGDCAIVLGGKPGAKVRDLKLGDKFVFNYDELSGVDVVNRIANSGAVQEPATVSARAANRAP
jgi:Cu/Ag efflux protein CusF